ncbi:MAG: alpha/beta hydrolase [Pseudomonadota bacterium]
MRLMRLHLVLFVALSLARPAAAEFLGAYDFPFVNPLVATVVGTPEAYQLENLPTFEIGRNSERLVLPPPQGDEIPDVFWYDQRGLNYGYAFQPGSAPLVILIAGTGGGFNSGKTVEVARVLFAGGYHVLSIPSPTFANFITTSSETHVPGRMMDDARDLYDVMKRAYTAIEDQIEIESVHLTGYSLGGINTAFVAKIDAEEGFFDFDRILVLNPPVKLINSVKILDGMLDRHVEDNLDAYNELLEDLFTEFARIYSRNDFLDLSGNFVFQFFKAAEPSNRDLEISIGLAFRLSSTNMAFVSDVMTESGYLIEPGKQLTPSSILSPYFRAGMLKNFNDYFEQLYLPYFQRTDPAFTYERAVRDASLYAIEDFLKSADNIGLITNEDDIILAPGEVEYLNDLFGDRAAIYPTGGHCGNYLQRDVATRIIEFFRQ